MAPDPIEHLASLLAPVFHPSLPRPRAELLNDAQMIASAFDELPERWTVSNHDPAYLFQRLGLPPTESEVKVIIVNKVTFIIEVFDEHTEIFTVAKWRVSNE